MKNQYLLYIGITMIVISIGLIAISALLYSTILLIFSIIILVVSVLFVSFITALSMFQQDAVRDFEELEKQGLTVIQCPYCDKKNVLEDIYCYSCGEKLVNNHDDNSL